MLTHTQWLIETKLLPPTLKNRQVVRPRLLNRLKDVHNSACVVIHAPAGYGKTTLLRQFYNQNSSANNVIAWLSLDDDDKELSQFYTYLLASIEKAGVSSDFFEGLLERNLGKVSVQQLVASLVALANKFSGNLLLILDDYHHAASETVSQFLQLVLSHLPDNITIIISSRVYPSLALEHLRPQGLVVDIDSSELQFDSNEAQEAVVENTPDSVVNTLLVKTEGWPIVFGLVNQMMSNSLLDEKGIENISGRTSELAAYITEQVLFSLSEAENSFLLQTSLLSRFTGDLADALSDEYDGWQVLEELARRELFLIPLDDEGKWYRYHPMFSEYLRERMQRLAGKKTSEVHSKAASWLFENHFIPEAIEHAIKSGDLNMAAAMLDDVGGWRLIYEGKLGFVSSMLDRLPRRLIKTYPRLLIADILRFIKLGEMSYAERLINELRTNTKDFTQWNGEAVSAKLKLDFSAVINITYEDYIDEPVTKSRVKIIEEHIKSVGPRDHILNALFKDALAYHAIDSGDFETATRYLDSAEKHYREFNSFYGIIFLYFHRARIFIEQIKFSAAKEALDQARIIATDYLGTDKSMLLRTNIYSAELAYLCNDLEQSKQLLEYSRSSFAESDGWFDLYASAYFTTASLHRRQFGLNACMNTLGRARIISYERKLPRLEVLADLSEINYLLLSEDLEGAQNLADKIEINQYLDSRMDAENISVCIPAISTIVICRLWIMSGLLQEAITLLVNLANQLEAKNLIRLLTHTWLLLGKAYFLSDKPDDAVDCVSRAANAAMHEGFKSAFVEEGESYEKIYQLTLNENSEGANNRYFNAFLNDVMQIIHTEKRDLNNLTNVHGLTDKEVAVVYELARGMSNKEIARLLFISQDAVKYRLKKIFSKWQVQSRDEVVRLAVEREITTPELKV